MDEFTADAFVNRDEPIPVAVFAPADNQSDEDYDDGTQPERKRDRLRRHAANIKETVQKAQGKASETGSSMQDRLLEKCILPLLTLAFTC
jgi:hypothetical protein